MTGQIRDCLIYNQDTFVIVKVSGNSLFNPVDYRIKTVALSSACWRGFHCTYKIDDSFLKIKELYLGLNYLDKKRLELGKFPKLFGKTLKSCEDRKIISLDYRYANLDHLIKFTGGILIGNNFIRKYLRPWYFPNIYKFGAIYELIFESGHLIKAINYSQEISKLRDRIGDREIDILEIEEIKQWAKDCFQFDYY